MKEFLIAVGVLMVAIGAGLLISLQPSGGGGQRFVEGPAVGFRAESKILFAPADYEPPTYAPVYGELWIRADKVPGMAYSTVGDVTTEQGESAHYYVPLKAWEDYQKGE